MEEAKIQNSSFLGQNFSFVTSTDPNTGKKVGPGKFAQLFNSENAAATGQIASMFSGFGNAMFGLQSRSQMYGGWRGAAKDANQEIMNKVNPLAGGLNQLSDTLSGGIAKAFGKSTDYSDGASQTFDTVTDALNYLGPWGSVANFALDTVNALTGTTIKGVQQSERVGASSSYGSVSSDMEKYAGDQTIGGFGRLMGSASKRRRQIARIQDRVNRTENLLERADDRKQASQWQGYGLRNWMELNGNPSPTHLAKQGMKLPNKTDITNIKAILSKKSGGTLLPPKPEFYSILAEELEEEVEAFKQGGTIIPEGALHARKNNMEGAGKDFTHKGIPVVDNKGEQQAEIERDEIIFSKEVTSKLEQLMNDGSDKAAIEAGKLLVKEIFENTDDRTGLIAAIVGEEPTPDEEDLTKFEEGGTVEIAKEGTKTPRKRKYDTPWKFMNYLNSTGRGLSDDYDYESFYNNEDAYFKWEDEEENSPGKAHMSGDFKKPNHITYSDEGFGWKGSDEDGWTFTVSPRQQSLRSYDTYVNYWNENEPESTLVYGDKTYKIKKND